MRRWIGIGLALIVAAGAVVAVASNGADRSQLATKASDGVPTGSGGVAQDRDEVATASSTMAAQANLGPKDLALALPQSDARVIRNATIELSVRRRLLDQRFTSARGVAAFFGGFVEQSQQSRSTASVTLRVPGPQFDAAIARLANLGRVTNRGERGDDVTAQFVDLDARVRNLTAQEAVLQDLMGQARTVPDTIAVQQQFFAVREQIEQLTGQRNLLDDQTTFATIAVTFTASGFVPANSEERGTLAQAWSDAVHVSAAVVGGTLVVLAAVLPIAVMAALGFAAWTVVRRRRPKVRPAGA